MGVQDGSVTLIFKPISTGGYHAANYLIAGAASLGINFLQ